jgi:hypothetical protein
MAKGAGGLRPSNFDPAALLEGDTIARIAGKVVATQMQPQNQGVMQRILGAAPSSSWLTPVAAYQTGTGTEGEYLDTPIAGASATFVAPVTGLYAFILTLSVFDSGGTGNGCNVGFRLKFTGATTITHGYVNKAGGADGATTNYEAWFYQARAGVPGPCTFITYAQLNAGSHTVTVQGRVIDTVPTTGVSTRAANISAGLLQLYAMSVGGTATLNQQTLRDSNYTLDTGFQTVATFTAVNSAVTSGSLTAPASGVYTFAFNAGWSNWNAVDPGGLRDYSVAQWRMKVDGVVVWTGGSSAISLWGLHQNTSALFQVALPAGVHTWAFEVQKVTGSHANSYVRVAGDASFNLVMLGGAALAKPLGQTNFKMEYASNDSITVSAVRGSIMRFEFTDGLMREHSGTLTMNFTNGVADNGLDTGNSRSLKTFYYIYAVPSGLDFVLRASTTAPGSGGPAANTAAWKYLGAIRTSNTGSGLVIPFKQFGNRTLIPDPWYIHQGASQSMDNTWTAIAAATTIFGVADTGPFLPVTAVAAKVQIKCDLGSANQFAQVFVAGITGGYFDLHVQPNCSSANQDRATALVVAELPIFTAQTLYRLFRLYTSADSYANPQAGTVAYVEIRSGGWVDRWLTGGEAA